MVAKRLLDDRQVRLRFIRDSSGAEYAIWPLEGTVGGCQRVRETGLTAQQENTQHGDRPAVVRYAQIEIPPRVPEIVDWLRKLAKAAVDREPALAEAGEQLAGQLAKCPSVAAWWAKWQKDADARVLVWRVLQRTSALLSSAELAGLAAAVLDEFARSEVLFTSALPSSPQRREAERESGAMVLVDFQRERQTLSVHRGVAVRMPNSEPSVLMPALLLRMPEACRTQRPLLECLAGLEPVLAKLRICDRDWQGWRNYDERVWDLVWGSDLQLSPEDDQRIAVELFEGFYSLAFDARRETAAFFKQIARAIYQCLVKQMHYESVPPLDPETLQYMRVEQMPVRDVEIEWDFKSGDELGTTVRVTKFGRSGKPGKLKISAGHGFPADLSRWPNLPAPPLLEQAGKNCPLKDWHKALRRLPFDAGRVAAIVESHVRCFRDWLPQSDGRAWLDALCQEIRQPSGDAAASQWFAALRDGKWLRVFPDIDPKSRQVFWPEGTSTAAPRVRWAFNAGCAARFLVSGPVRFSPDAEFAEGCFSLGPQIADNALDLACRLEEHAVVERIADPLLGVIRSLAVAVRDRHFGVSGVGFEDAARSVLDALPAANEAAYRDGVPASGALAALDGAMKNIERFLGQCGLAVAPPGWSFSDPPAADALTAGENASVRYEFSARLPLRTTAVRQFRLCPDADRLQGPEIGVSAGPPPKSYREFAEILKSLADPQSEALADQLGVLPRAVVEGTVEYYAAQIFNRFWDEFGSVLVSGDAEDNAWLETVTRASELLCDLISELGMTVIHPTGFAEFGSRWETWLEIVPSSGGMHMRELRPAVAGADKNCLVPAKVIME